MAEKKGRYVPVFDIHYKCSHCGREMKTNALKEPMQCPFCENGSMHLVKGKTVKVTVKSGTLIDWLRVECVKE